MHGIRQLRELVAEELSQPVDPRASEDRGGDRGEAWRGVAGGAVLRLVPAREDSSMG